jgi:hypothetical protein
MLDYSVHADCFDPAQERADGAGDIQRRARSVSSGREELMFGRGKSITNKAKHIAWAAEAIAVFQQHCRTSDERATQTQSVICGQR